MALSDHTHTNRPPTLTTPKPDIPKGWEPGIQWSGKSGTIVSPDLTAAPDAAAWREILADWGEDAAGLEIVDGSIEFTGWDALTAAADGGKNEVVRLKRYKARLRKRQDDERHADVEALCKLASKRKPPRRKTITADEGDRGLVVALADWQLGKGEGDGTEGTVNRITAATGRILDRLDELKRLGRPVGAVYLVGLGDLVEGCSDHYAMQTWSADLTRRDQLKVGRRLILQMVDALVDAGYPIVLTGVAGNHGENRANGKTFTDWEDNDDLAMIEQVGDILASNPDRYGSVSTYLPKMLSMTVDIYGARVGFAHGHQVRGGALKVGAWWKDQIVGGQPTASAQILVTGHFHHLVVNEAMGRTHMQCPAMDPGSRWWTEMSGQSSPAGMLTFAAGECYGGRGYGDLAIL